MKGTSDEVSGLSVISGGGLGRIDGYGFFYSLFGVTAYPTV